MSDLNIKEIPYCDPIEVYECVKDRDYALLFDGNDLHHPSSRYSYIVFDPIKIVKSNDTDIFDALKSKLKNTKSHSGLPPFQGGWAGYCGYDLGFDLEPSIKRKHDSSTLPKAIFGLYDKVISFDHKTKQAWLIGDVDIPNFGPQTVLDQDYQLNWQSDLTQSQYETQVQKIIDYIHEGDIFQANMAMRFSTPLPKDFDRFEHYKILRSVNPAPYSAYLNFDDVVISSVSPELFLSASPSGHVTTMPIKGTRPSNTDPEDLLNSSKDHAENTMIVDLLRNDLAKSCTAESVEVPKLCALETFSHVHHLVSTVTGHLKDNTSAIDLLKNAFPGGSITGAPKIRAMEIIEELETASRGPYCGSLALIGHNGMLESSITIRTLIFEEDLVHFNAGSGIVADSNPHKEYLETLSKAQGIFESFQSVRSKGKIAS